MVEHHQPSKLAGAEGGSICEFWKRETDVFQTLILTYVTIPSHKRVAELGDSPCVFKEYSVREVTIRRFIPARMRD